MAFAKTLCYPALQRRERRKLLQSEEDAAASQQVGGLWAYLYTGHICLWGVGGWRLAALVASLLRLCLDLAGLGCLIHSVTNLCALQWRLVIGGKEFSGVAMPGMSLAEIKTAVDSALKEVGGGGWIGTLHWGLRWGGCGIEAHFVCNTQIRWLVHGVRGVVVVLCHVCHTKVALKGVGGCEAGCKASIRATPKLKLQSRLRPGSL